LGHDLLHLLFLFSQLFLGLYSILPVNKILVTAIKLHIANLRNNVGESDENGHNNKLNKSFLPWSYLGRFSVTEHRHLKSLRLLTISLIEKFFKEEVGPDRAEVKFSQGCTDITSMNKAIRDKLLSSLYTFLARTID